MKWKFKLRTSAVIAITAVIGIVMITSAYLELKQGKEELYHILNEQSLALIETITESSINTINSGFEIEDLITERLLNNARLIRELDRSGILTRQKLIDIGKANDLYRINIFNGSGDRELSNRVPELDHSHGEANINRSAEIQAILDGSSDEIIIGLKEAEFNQGQRYAVAVARSNHRGAIVVNLDAEELLDFRKKIGIGKIIQDISHNSGIKYIALQDTGGILAASTNIDSLDAVHEDVFLRKAMKNDSVYYRTLSFAGDDVYEVVKRLTYENSVVGIFRIGLALDELKIIEARAYKRILLITLILAAVSIISLSIVFTTQNLKTISEEFNKFKTFTGSILKNMDEAVIVVNKDLIVSLINRSAQKLFGIKEKEIVGRKLLERNDFTFLEDILISERSMEKFVSINSEGKYLLISPTANYDDHSEIESYTIVLNDITDKKLLEENSRRKEKLSAMGELASGVAHEIRNPINAIGMIAQRLQKEFAPEGGSCEFNSITGLLRTEVTRINKIIKQFLDYAKPLEVKTEIVNAGDYFSQVYQLFSAQADKRRIRFTMNGPTPATVELDPELMKQALMNLIQNAFDSVGESGTIDVDYQVEGNKMEILVSDNGKGIPREDQKRIFDLYYTSRKDGMGIGLSITQKIIEQHGGSISFESIVNEGTKFKVVLPQ